MHECNVDKKFSVINPSKMCQPMGAVQALLGLKDTMPVIHGSQGCSTYMRFQLTRHFREPIEVASTSMNEKTVIYGGEYNLMKALKNITEKQSPRIIAVTSSCLTETIGDDMRGIIKKFRNANIGKDLPLIIPISTPSYADSHVEGYNKTIKALVEHLAINSAPNNKLNIITGILSPTDVGEIKSILNTLKCDNIILTDTSENLDAPLSESALGLYNGGTTADEIANSANSNGTISLSKHADSAGLYLENKFNVTSISGPLPAGIENTDKFINNVCELMDLDIPQSIIKDRGRLLDAMVDSHSYNYHRKVAIFGDPDFVSGMARFTVEMGMIPSVLCTGSKSKRFIEDINILKKDKHCSPLTLAGGDLYDLHQKIKELGADILIGNSYGATIAKKENIPLIRAGFPVFDRVGAQRISLLGYKGGINFVDRITNTILDYYYDESGYELEDEIFELKPVTDEGGKKVENCSSIN